MEESIDLTIVIRCEKLISKHLRLQSCPRLVELPRVIQLNGHVNHLYSGVKPEPIRN